MIGEIDTSMLNQAVQDLVLVAEALLALGLVFGVLWMFKRIILKGAQKSTDF